MLETLIFILALNIIGFLIAYKFQTDKLTDISYAVSFASIAFYNMAMNAMSSVQWAVFLLVMIWASRLGAFLLYRVSVKGKDARFDGMRENFFAFGKFWVTQGLTAWVVMLPVSFFLQNELSTQFTAYAVTGIVIAALAIVFEAIADWQKFTFGLKANKKTPWIQEGLWKYSRHPNYFGEILVWIGIYIACYPWLSDTQALAALLSPFIIILLLTRISGIPILEKSADEKWGSNPEYQAYKRRTSTLIPIVKKD